MLTFTHVFAFAPSTARMWKNTGSSYSPFAWILPSIVVLLVLLMHFELLVAVLGPWWHNRCGPRVSTWNVILWWWWGRWRWSSGRWRVSWWNGRWIIINTVQKSIYVCDLCREHDCSHWGYHHSEGGRLVDVVTLCMFSNFLLLYVSTFSYTSVYLWEDRKVYLNKDLRSIGLQIKQYQYEFQLRVNLG